MEPKQCNTKYHHLHGMIKELTLYVDDNELNPIYKLIRSLYLDWRDNEVNKDDKGKYGIRFNTIGEDSRYKDKNEVFFSSETRRNDVFDDWSNGLYWDDLADDELSYRTPGPNFCDSVKIFKNKDKIYVE